MQGCWSKNNCSKSTVSQMEAPAKFTETSLTEEFLLITKEADLSWVCHLMILYIGHQSLSQTGLLPNRTAVLRSKTRARAVLPRIVCQMYPMILANWYLVKTLLKSTMILKIRMVAFWNVVSPRAVDNFV